MKKSLAGFTLIELIVTLSILVILTGLTSVNLLGFYAKNTLNTSIPILISDLKQQQLKAMVGDTEGDTSHAAYGIYFQSDRYTLFQGSSYSDLDTANFDIILNRDLQFSNIILPGSQIVFASGSGEVANYNQSFDYVTLKNTSTDETKTVRINQYGTIINIY
ncbi:hypothetical protein A3A46_04100 [Candidatus Roizmanbacteria bacterium RIFCSPLOWO2_01_FULL_37_13]|uniref:General secretion pathway GspH domain-containing protein n=1 Tax=Candidatus Roizmanbacteria bacterium RIFCSPHIGHO2_02_FULL_38_11 TaxID=1802039 RepID=A0A1F7H1Y7_9BACT|nr:MAG: hypothetical protein A3C25_03340 [Candidatus Roizmanbacteria bacterium RIFCSPHIGHO2_02_FULL_38_11]OGK40958.1 MAG: hypothetical protein A3A46_04100 [Candidatus Roizmanbacteria bacterium RIFCSPLOWO2_01_FULL_37_13]